MAHATATPQTHPSTYERARRHPNRQTAAMVTVAVFYHHSDGSDAWQSKPHSTRFIFECLGQRWHEYWRIEAAVTDRRLPPMAPHSREAPALRRALKEALERALPGANLGPGVTPHEVYLPGDVIVGAETP